MAYVFLVTCGIGRHLENNIFRSAEIHDGSAHVVRVPIFIVMRVCGCQIDGDVVSVISLK